MISWLLALLASSQVPYELIALVFHLPFLEFRECKNNSCTGLVSILLGPFGQTLVDVLTSMLNRIFYVYFFKYFFL